MLLELSWLLLTSIVHFVFLVLALLTSYGLFLYIKHLYHLKNYPPGPFPLPIIGNLHKLKNRPHESFTELSKVYGDVFSVSMGMHRFVIINTIEAARESLIGNSVAFAGRPNTHYLFQLVSRGFKNIAMSDYGPHWKLNRKLGHSALKMYGEDAGKSEVKVARESKELCSRLKRNLGEPVDVHLEIGNAVANVICSTVFGERYETDDPRFLDILAFINFAINSINFRSPVIYIPWIRHIFRISSLENILKALKIRDGILHSQLQRHRETFDPERIRDLTDSLIQASKDGKLWEDIGIDEVTDDHLEMIMNDIFVAGSHTTAGTLRWCILYLLHWPNYQDLIFDEIINTIGTERYPTLADRTSLPLVQSALQETLRLASITPMGIPHKTTKDVTICGDKHLPKDTQVMFNLWNIHHNETHWEKPFEFNPYRWLNEEKKYVPGVHKSFLPFSAGRRVCLGESLAKAELFLFFSRLIRDFKILPNTDEPFPGLTGIPSALLFPSQFTVRLSLRHPVIHDK